MSEVVVACIVPEVVEGLIGLLKKLRKRTTEEQNDIRQNIVKTINKHSYLRNFDGIKIWSMTPTRCYRASMLKIAALDGGNGHGDAIRNIFIAVEMMQDD
jgi:hypothetical protein